ncbi:MYXO-CTERM sorting domain-containing protein [Hyalangium versicolor]|uniref:MYXO-CTERM sorting domain-containing protein n=1 Tax=Hyalangium versicolor TaxID=2861190 RepID=UPI001CCAD623|nr:MYXO-CTERM sorting domain-containing protein [Hyalangium versicolor]
MTAAHADWEVKTVQGTPNDVQVWAPGVYSVATTSGGYLFQGGGVSNTDPVASSVMGTRLKGNGCFDSYSRRDPTQSKPNGCLRLNIFVDQNADLARVKSSGSGAAYALGKSSMFPSTALVAFSPGDLLAWGPQPKPELTGNPMALGAVSQGGAEHALVALGAVSGEQVDLYWFVDGGQRAVYGMVPDAGPPDAGLLPAVQAIDLFPAGGTTPTALFSWGSDLYRGPLVNGTQPSFVKVPLPTPAGTVTGVDVNTGAGSQYGDGFGMLVVQHDGGSTVLSAVPAASPEEIGRQWKVNPLLDAGVAPQYVSCQGATTCVIAQKDSGGGNLLVYTNDAGPTISTVPSADAGVTLNEGTQDVLFAIRASDPDGDAVRVTASFPSNAPELTFTRTDVEGGADLKVSAGAVCKSSTVPLTVVASDGLASHDEFLTVPFNVVHTRKAGRPDLSSSNFVVWAGEEPLTITATPAQNPPCPPLTYAWSVVSPMNAPALANNQGSTATFNTPDTLCQRDGATYRYRVQTLDEGGLPSDPRDFSVQLLPWGKPNAPFSAPQNMVLLAGDSVQGSVRLRPDWSVHACESNPNFPGVDTYWKLESVPLAGVRLLTEDRKLVTNTEVFTTALLVETDACATGQVKLTVKHYTHDGSGVSGPSSPVTVSVDPDLSPLDQAVLDVSLGTVTPETASGTLKVSQLNCIGARGNVTVRVLLTSDDGSTIQGDFPIPDSGERPWQLPLRPVCQGQSYHLQAELLGRSGIVEDEVPVPPAEVQWLPAQPRPLTVSCGSAASGTLEQQILDGPCADSPVTWEQRSGPELTLSSNTGSQIEVTSKEAEFGDLIGQDVVMRITANTGKATSIDQTIPITAEPFVSVQRRVENAVGADTDLIGVSVELNNLTSCGVHQVDHMEHMEGAAYVAGSARFNDAPVEAQMEDDWLTVRGLSLEGNSVGRLTYVVRPRLLGKTNIEGQSFVRGVPVSKPLVVPVSGCSCEGGGSGFAVLGLVGLAVALRRRRARC